MKHIKWKTLLITCLVCVAPILLGIAMYDKLPDSMAIHFDMNNDPDGFASKAFAVFAIPLLMLPLQIFCCVLNDIMAHKHGERKKFSRVTKWIVPILSLILYTTTIFYALGFKNMDIRRIAVFLVAMIFLVIGNYMPKFDHIQVMGKVKKVEGDKARKIHRFIGYVTVIMGLIFLVTMFLPPIASTIALFLMIPYAITCIVYGIKIGKEK